MLSLRLTGNGNRSQGLRELCSKTAIPNSSCHYAVIIPKCVQTIPKFWTHVRFWSSRDYVYRKES